MSLWFILLLSFRAEAYPEFIGHGYTSCVACHWSATGGGGLTDYGRALFANTLAAKPFGMGNDEALGEWSGFFGKAKTPNWFKPSYNFRRLYNEINPGSPNKQSRYYGMQNDFSLASFFDEDFKFGLVATYAIVDNPLFAAPNRRIGNSSGMAREYYARVQMTEAWWLYAGFMDKAYGIKTPDHSAVNRAPIHMGENDQVHSVLLSWQNPTNDLMLQPFLGNLHLPGAAQSRGVSILYEHEPAERLRIGASFKTEKSRQETSTDVAATLRRGLGNGHALLTELGLKQDKLADSPTTKGMYNYTLLQYELARGFNLQSIFEYNRNDFSNNVPDQMIWGFGILYFPMQRIEWRMQALHQRVHQDNAVEDEQWIAQAQLHLSF